MPDYLSYEIRTLFLCMQILTPKSRATLPCLWQHLWVKTGQEKPLLPLCEADLKVTVWMPLSSMWDQSQKSESLSLNSPRVGPRAITVKPSPTMNSSTQKLQPLGPEVGTSIPALLFLWETIQMQETNHDSKLTDSTPPPPTASASCHSGVTPSTSGTYPSRGTHHSPDTHRTQCTPDTPAPRVPATPVARATSVTFTNTRDTSAAGET